ncbi:hypothetical protein [Akkermansia glycaniphila]|uniref:Glycosyltransferase family 25 (Lps biosynthesis protein) n=1 Tax=Akkermansia glycaniphila TaxID=1679444 RepID=A0A1H6LS77_9BACT|nr:hypothetical protein [Akkermansia glycaniphila]SEH91527.1 glycosyltransferase family 25 (lps biosynthesis protein) [Akkermansia glycaniphila]
MKNFWDRIDGVYTINMDYRPDRWDQLVKETSGMIPEGKLRRVSGVVGVDLPGYGEAPWFTARTGERSTKWAGVGGCTLSHRKAIESAKQDGCSYALILEDDAAFHADDGASNLLARFLEHDPGGWGLLYAGFHGMPPFGSLQDREGGYELWKLPGVIAAHAYVVSSQSWDSLLAHLPTERTIWPWLARFRAIDNYYRDHLSHDTGLSVYGLAPSWIYQRPSWSDLGQEQVDYTCLCHAGEKPRSIRSLGGLLCRMTAPLHRMKIELNSFRTLRRARQHGFPGNRKSKDAPED